MKVILPWDSTMGFINMKYYHAGYFGTNPSSWNERPIWLTFGDAGDDERLIGNMQFQTALLSKMTEWLNILPSWVHTSISPKHVVDSICRQKRWLFDGLEIPESVGWFLGFGDFYHEHPPKINIELENDGLEDYVPLPRVSCQQNSGA